MNVLPGVILIFTLTVASCRVGVLQRGTTDRHQLIGQILLLIVCMGFFGALSVILEGNLLAGAAAGLVAGLLWDLHEAPDPLLRRKCIQKRKDRLLKFARKLEQRACLKDKEPRDDAPPL